MCERCYAAGSTVRLSRKHKKRSLSDHHRTSFLEFKIHRVATAKERDTLIDGSRGDGDEMSLSRAKRGNFASDQGQT